MNELVITHRLSIPFNELILVTSRSGGPGGQNVNKLETRVELRFDIAGSPSLSPDEKAVLAERLRSRLDRHGILRIVSQESRSQWQNKQIVLERFGEIVRNALKPRKKRKPTKPTRNSRELRLKEKRIRSERKKTRRPEDE
ncbi:MAG: alternative ribosome rescue aminoacyl-tRNA hydrolase ArfB [Bacteroidota bacterium]